jgi:hypothetical protein
VIVWAIAEGRKMVAVLIAISSLESLQNNQ